MIELDKVIGLFEQGEKDKGDLVRKMQILIGVERDTSVPAPTPQGPTLGNNSMVNNQMPPGSLLANHQPLQ